MKKYLVAGIIIEFSYKYDKYFKNNIESYFYDTDIKADHQLIVNYNQNLELPNHKQYKIFSRTGEDVKAFMTFTDNYEKIEIYIDDTKYQDPATVEYIYTGMVFLELALKHGLIALHGSAITYKDQVVIFSAPSGTGKSTHAKMWKELFEGDVSWINDDKPLLKVENNEVFVYGAPFSGQFHSNTNTKKQLKSIVFLSQGITDDVKKLNKKEALKNLLTNTLRPQEEKEWDSILEQLDTVISNIDIYHLDATLSLNAVKTIKKTIFGE